MLFIVVVPLKFKVLNPKFRSPKLTRYFLQINLFVQKLAKKYPDRVELEMIGKSSEKRAINLMKIGFKNTANNATKTNKKIVWIDAGIHAREWIAPSSALFIANQVSDLAMVIDERVDDLEQTKNPQWRILNGESNSQVTTYLNSSSEVPTQIHRSRTY